MRKSLFGVLFIVLFISGCIGPLARFKKAKTQTTVLIGKTNQITGELLEKSKGYVYSAKLTLQMDPDQDKFNSLGQDLLDKSLAITGDPTLKDINELKVIITNLLSTNALIRAQGVKLLNEKDQQVIKLQSQLDSVNKDLLKQQEKNNKIAEESAQLGQKWFNLWKWIKIIGFVIVGGFILNTICLFLPVPYNQIGTIIGIIPAMIIKFVHSIAPNVKSLAGVVDQSVHDDAKNALGSLVTSIQQIKTQNPTVYTSTIQPVLSANATAVSPVTISVNAVKDDLNLK